MHVRWGPTDWIRCQLRFSAVTKIPEQYHSCSLLTEHSGNPPFFNKQQGKYQELSVVDLKMIWKTLWFFPRTCKTSLFGRCHLKQTLKACFSGGFSETIAALLLARWGFGAIFGTLPWLRKRLEALQLTSLLWWSCLAALSFLSPWRCQWIQPRRTGGYVYASLIVLARSGWKVRDGWVGLGDWLSDTNKGRSVTEFGP